MLLNEDAVVEGGRKSFFFSFVLCSSGDERHFAAAYITLLYFCYSTEAVGIQYTPLIT